MSIVQYVCKMNTRSDFCAVAHVHLRVCVCVKVEKSVFDDNHAIDSEFVLISLSQEFV